MEETRVSLAGLGYVGIEAPDPAGWRDFATTVCGLTPAQVAPAMAVDGTAYLKLDSRQWRLAVHPSEKAGLAYLGFELRSASDFDRAVEGVRAQGVEIQPGKDAECALRGVERLAVLHDPAGHRLELFHGPVVDDAFRSPTGIEFLTAGLGMGHVVLYVPDVELGLAFYRDVLGFQRSDYMTFGSDGQGIHFLRCTRRHHSVALLQVGDLSGLQHLMLESTTLDGVGGALDRALAEQVEITSSLGRHRNDKTVSFYMKGPSGFDIEIGWDGLLVEDDWVEHEFAGGGDDWGHHGLTAESLKPKE